MKILVINCGSSSIKAQLFDHASLQAIAKGHLDGIGQTFCCLEITNDTNSTKENLQIKTIQKGIDLIIEKFIKLNFLKSKTEISHIGHRFVHGGTDFTQDTLITEKNLALLEKTSHLAPLHNPSNLLGIRYCLENFPHAKSIAIFDTAFHQTMPSEAYTYGIDLNFRDQKNIRRYGFHGINHQYVVEKAISQNPKASKIISCHLGNGCSIAATANGKSIDTSMGFTPLEGLIMGSRSGDLDPGIIFYLAEQEKMPIPAIKNLLNHQSGLKALSTFSSDMREIYQASLDKKHPHHENSLNAIKIFSYRLSKYIGSYIPILGGLDTLIFTGGLGEKAFYIREMTCQKFTFMKLQIDQEKNRQNTQTISTENSQIKVLVIPANEELQIAKSVKNFKL
jgi:acetate kinase